jgi:hypothetical protein
VLDSIAEDRSRNPAVVSRDRQRGEMAPPRRRDLRLRLDRPAGMADELEPLRQLTERRQRAEREWVEEIRRLFAAGHSIEEISAVAQVRYEVIVELVRPAS